MRHPAIDRLLPRPAGPRLFPRPRTGHAEYAAASPGGTPFLPDELDSARLIVLAGFGADLTKDPAFWAANFVDITSDVLQDNGRTISIKIGRQDWSSFAYPAQLTLSLKNLTGNYSAYNPMAKYWPNLVQGTPIWVLLYVGGVYYTRFYGEATGWKPGFDVTGNYAIVTLTAAGSLQRATSGTGNTSPTYSPYAQAILAAGPKHYWPIEDGTTAPAAAAVTNGSPPMAVNSAVGAVRFGTLNPYTFGQSEGIKLTQGTTFGLGQLAQHKEGGALRAFFPATATPWSVQFLAFCAFDATDTDQIYSPCGWVTADGAVWQIYYDPFGTDTTYLTYNGTHVCTVNSIWVFDDMRVDAVQSGSDISVTFTRQPFPPGTYQATGTITGKTLYGITSIATNPKQMVTKGDWATAHVRVWETVTEPDFMKSTAAVSALYGYAGETVTTRLSRICAQLGIPYNTVGKPSTITMGVQPVDTRANLLRECESTDGGILYDGLGPGLQFQPLAARYNATAVLSLNAAQGDLQPPYQPTDDLYGRVNAASVTSRSGSTAAYTATTGTLGTARIGVFGGSPPVAPNYFDNAMLAARAGWEARKGTVEGFRYPLILLNLRHKPTKVPGWLAVTPGSLMSITPPYPTQLTTDTISACVEGWQEDLAKLQWTVSAFCSRGDVYTVAAVGTARVDTAGSTLAADAPAGSTSLSVASTSTVWSTTASSYTGGLDFWIDGVRVTVTGVSGGSSPQTFTCNPIARQLYAGNTVHLWTRAYPALG